MLAAVNQAGVQNMETLQEWRQKSYTFKPGTEEEMRWEALDAGDLHTDTGASVGTQMLQILFEYRWDFWHSLDWVFTAWDEIGLNCQLY